MSDVRATIDPKNYYGIYTDHEFAELIRDRLDNLERENFALSKKLSDATLAAGKMHAALGYPSYETFPAWISRGT